LGALVNVEFDRVGASIRVAELAELPAILALTRTCGLLEPGIAEVVDRFSIAKAKGRTVGVCGLEKYDDVGLLRTLGVDPEYRNRGLGRKLVETTLTRARVERLHTIYLLTTTAPEFFARLGFQAVSRGTAPSAIQQSWEFRSGCPANATLMLRSP
jgi:amino-acid N-acetyltransferase